MRRRSGRSLPAETPVIGSPSNITVPAVGSISPSTMRAIVLLPDPDSPTSPSVSPRSMRNETLSTTVTAP